MDRERFQRVEELFHRALELPQAQRAEFLVRECGQDEALRRDVERLLAGDARADEGVERFELFGDTEDPLIGRSLGPWRILERIAEGGMGVVYRAERADGLYEQHVAVKVLRLEVATADSLRRFELERRLLARLEHPNIARMLDGGRGEHGTPYLVMEFVDGSPIDRWCNERQLSLEARLKLFANVCRTVHFAHQNLVVHRDLKPSNVMVDRHGHPKLLDFGIARLVDDESSSATLTGVRPLTPQYASPEQLQGLSLTTATDVYSLGVVLYELLTGRRPWKRVGRTPAEWERIVTTDEPTRPSTAVEPRAERERAPATDFAARLHTTPSRLHRRLRGDLDRIVLMALRKEPARRYASAEQLAEDIERYLGDLPIRARDDTLGYRMQRFVARNRLAVGSAVLVLLALFGGLFVSWRARVRAERSAELARIERERAVRSAIHARIEAQSFEIIAAFLGDTLLRGVGGPDRRDRVAANVSQQAGQVRRQYADQPHLRANLLDALGGLYAQLDMLELAAGLLSEARDIRVETFGRDSMEYALSMSSLGELAFQRGDFVQAAELLGEAVELHRKFPEDVHSDVAAAMNDLAAALRNLGRIDDALALHEQALELRRAGGAELPVAESLHNLAVLVLAQGDVERADVLTREATEIRSRILGPQHTLTLQSRVGEAGIDWRLGRHDAAAEKLYDVVEGFRSHREAGVEGVVNTLGNLVTLELARGRPEVAEDLARQALEGALELYGAEHVTTALARSRLGSLLALRGERAAAIEAWREVLRVRRQAYPPEHPSIASTVIDLAHALVGHGEAVEAETLVRAALEALDGAADPAAGAKERAMLELVLGTSLVAQERSAEARPHFESARDASTELEGPTSAVARRAQDALDQLDGE